MRHVHYNASHTKGWSVDAGPAAITANLNLISAYANSRFLSRLYDEIIRLAFATLLIFIQVFIYISAKTVKTSYLIFNKYIYIYARVCISIFSSVTEALSFPIDSPQYDRARNTHRHARVHTPENPTLRGFLFAT